MLKAAAQGASTKELIIAAALQVLKEEGFSGATARAIAQRGEVNQALIFYHFGSVRALLLAALDVTSAERLARYETALAAAHSPGELVAVARELYSEDVASGHTTVLAEMIAGGINDPELKPALVQRVDPWIAVAESAIAKAVGGTPLESILPTRDLAFAIVAFYIGIELVTALEDERSRAQDLLEMAERFMPLINQASGTRP